jgi:hypothetical protein
MADLEKKLIKKSQWNIFFWVISDEPVITSQP